MLFDDFDDDEQSPLMFSDDEQMVSGDTGGERQSLEDDGQTYIGMDVEILQDELSQSAFEVCELQFNNEMLQASNMELKQKVETLTALCRKYVDRYMNLSIAYQNSVRNIKHLTVLLNKVQFGAKILKNDDAKTRFYTGLSTKEVFDTMFTILEPFAGKKVSSCSLSDELFLTLAKLRLGLTNKDLAYRANIDEPSVSKIFHKWIDLMYCELKQLIVWPDPVTLRENLPVSFKEKFSSVVCIIDCFEIFIERPQSFQARAATYSNYKKHNTVKILIGITPTGSISFISKAWGGRVSDKVITQKSGFLDKIKYGDVVMADRGFNIPDELAINGARLEIPAFTKGKKQLSREEVEKTRQLARVRIHVERVIG